MDNDNEQNNNFQSQTPESNNDQSNQPVVMQPFNNNQPSPKSNKIKKLVILTLSMIMLVSLSLLAYSLLTNKEDTKEAVVKKDIQVLKYAVQSDGLNIEMPLNNADVDTNGLLYQTHEALVAWSKETSFAPALAKSWTSPDATTWEFVIDSGRQFNTGTPITPNTIKSSIEAYIASDSELPSVQTIESVKTEGSDKLIIKTKSADAILLNRLATLFIYDTKYEKGNAWSSGSGAYKLKEGSQATDDTLSLTAVESYPKGKPYVKEIQLTNLSTIKNPAEELSKGTFDMQTDGPTSQSEAAKYTSYALSLKKASGAYTLRLNNKTGKIFSNKTLRQAVATGLNMQKVIDADTDLAGTKASQIASDLIPGFNPDIKAIQADASKAKTLIAESGYKNEKITVGYFAGRQDKPMLEIIRQLKELGLNITVSTKDNGGDFVKAITNNEYDIVSASSLSNYGDLSDIATDVGGKNSYVPVYYNEAVDVAVAAASKVFEPEERLVELQKISKLIAEDYGIIPIRYSLYPTYVKKNLVLGNNDIPTESFGVYFYKIYSL